MSQVSRADEELVIAAQQGDRDDFATLYERYFDPIYDYLVRLTRNRELAADLAQDTFIRAMQKIDQLEQPAAFKGWIYRIARSQALNRLDREKRSIATAPVEDDKAALNPLLTQIDTDRLTSPTVAAEIEEVADLVWEAAEGLDERTYTVLDLTVRHGFDSAEIAEVMGVSTGNAYTMVSRMKDRVESAIGAYVMARKADQNCSDLQVIIHGVELPPMTPELAKSVNRHVDGCDVCDARRRKLVAPANVMAAFAAVEPPEGLTGDVWNELEGRWELEGPQPRRRRLLSRAGIMGGLLVILVVAGIAGAIPLTDPLPPAETVVAAPDPGPGVPEDELSALDATEETESTTEATTTPTTETTETTEITTATEKTAATQAPPPTPAETTPTVPPTEPPPPTETTPTTGAPNQAPIVAVNAPSSGAQSCVGDTVSFTGTVTDPEGEFIPLENVLWRSSLDGELGRGTSTTAVPSVGTHTITFSAEDSQSAVGSTTITIEVLGARSGPCATPPTVTIRLPVDGSVFTTPNSTEAVVGEATVTDDFDTGLVVSWTSSVDGSLGTGNVLTFVLTAGCPALTHTITASVTDSDGATGSASVTVTVGC